MILRTIAGGSSCLPQPVLEVAHGRHVEVGQLHVADERDDVVIDMLAVLLDGRAFEPCGLPCPDPTLGRLRDGHALAGGDVDTFADIDLDLGLRASASFLRANVSRWR